MKKSGNRLPESEQGHAHKKIPLDKVEVIDNEISTEDRRPGNEVFGSVDTLSLFVKPAEDKKAEPVRKDTDEKAVVRPGQLKFNVVQTDNAKVLESLDKADDYDDDDEENDNPFVVQKARTGTVKEERAVREQRPQVRRAPEGSLKNASGEVRRPAPQRRPDPRKGKAPVKSGAPAAKRPIEVKRVKKARHKSGKKAFVICFVMILVVAAALTGAYFYIKSQGFKGNYGQCTWTLDNKGVLTISGSGSTTGEYSQTFGFGKPAPDSIREVVINEGVTDIPENFTAGMSGLTKVTIPSTVTSIGKGAFNRSSSLAEIAVAEGNTYYSSLNGDLYTKDQTLLIAYASGKADTSFTVPDSVIYIGPEAFESSKNLQTVNIGVNLQMIDHIAFIDCPSLAGFTVDTNNNFFKVDDGILLDGISSEIIRFCPADPRTEYTLGQSIHKLCAGSFEGCNNLTSVTMPEGLVVIDNFAFYRCNSLVNAEMPDSVGIIGTSAFAECPVLVSSKLPAGITRVPSNLYWGCKSISSIEIPGGVTEIGEGAFALTSVASVTIPDAVLTLGSNAFGGCGKLTSVTLPATLETIANYTFNQCTSLTEIVIPSSVTTIGYAAFNGCTSLASVSIPDSVIGIGDFAFKGCTGLTSVSIGSGMTSIGNSAFDGCTNLTSATYSGGQSAWASVSVGGNNKPLTKAIKF